MIVKIKVIPGAPESQIFVIAPDQLKVKLVSRPEKGKANKELVELLADHFGVAKSCVRILHGEHSREKSVEIIIPSP
jgi:hypothetical protein